LSETLTKVRRKDNVCMTTRNSRHLWEFKPTSLQKLHLEVMGSGSGWLKKELGAACLNSTKSILDHNLAAICHVVGYKPPSPLPLCLLHLQTDHSVSCSLTCLARIRSWTGWEQTTAWAMVRLDLPIARKSCFWRSALTLIVLVSQAPKNWWAGCFWVQLYRETAWQGPLHWKGMPVFAFEIGVQLTNFMSVYYSHSVAYLYHIPALRIAC